MISIGQVDLRSLLLDTDNPRLPVGLDDRTQIGMLTHLYRTAALQELAESIYSNGFFSSEPIIVGKANGQGQRVVLEGNRRLATALVLAQEARAQEAELSFRIDGVEAVMELPGLPAVEIDDADEFEAYLGFRHISGLRMWGAGEKARYIWDRVRKLDGQNEPFYRVGRQIGSNSRGVRSAYTAYELLQHAEREGVDSGLISYVVSSRFGVWTRLLGTKNLAPFIEMDATAVSFPEVQSAIQNVNIQRLAEVLEDLRPRSGRAQAVLRDSRMVTDYSDVIGDPAAHDVLKSSGSLDLATTVANRPDVDGQIQGIIDQIEVVVSLVADGVGLTGDTPELSARLVKSSRLLMLSITAFSDEA